MTPDTNWSAANDRDATGITNQDRVDRVYSYYHSYKLGEDGDLNPAEDECPHVCIDFIADLLHLSASEGWNANAVLERAQMNFEAER